jgi:D-amino peptidase
VKVYISADIEGICGIAHWDEATETKPDYAEFRERMTSHVAAACEGAIAAGAEEILVKDAHGTGRNIYADQLPRCARVVRGWSGHPLMMVQELDDSYDAVLFLGYHCRAGSGGNPMAHTMSSSRIAEMRIGRRRVAEFHLFGWAAGYFGVPVALVSGDEALCRDVQRLNRSILTLPVMQGHGGSTVALHPAEAEDAIRVVAEEALRRDLSDCHVLPPENPTLRIRYRTPEQAYPARFYPGCRAVDDLTVELEAEDYFDVLRALLFLIGV